MILYPKEITLVITNSCNLRCTYCCERGIESAYKINTIDINIVKKCIDILAPQDDGYLAMFGGEATLHIEILEEALEYFKSKYPDSNMRLGITTNGVNINDRVLKWMIDAANSSHFSILLSMDGCRESHDLNRRTVGGLPTYDLIMNNLKRIHEASPKIKIERHSVLSKYDCNHMEDVCRSALETSKYCTKHTCSFTMLGQRSSVDDYSRDDLDAYISFYYKYIKPDNSRLFSPKELDIVRKIYRTIIDIHPIDRYDPRMWEDCVAGYDEFLVDINGSMYPCIKYYSELANTDYITLNIMDFNPTLELPDNHHYAIYKQHHDDQSKLITRFRNENGDRCETCPAMHICTNCIGHGECSNTRDPYIRPLYLCNRMLMVVEVDTKYQLEYAKKCKNELLLKESKLMYEIENGVKLTANQVINDNNVIRNELMTIED